MAQVRTFGPTLHTTRQVPVANIQLPLPPKQASSDQAPDQEVASTSSTERDFSQKKPLCYHDVKIVKGNSLGYYAIIAKLGDLCKLNDDDDEVEINYLKKSFGKWAVVNNDLDSRMICELNASIQQSMEDPDILSRSKILLYF